MDHLVVVTLIRQRDNKRWEDKYQPHTKLSEVRKRMDWMKLEERFARKNMNMIPSASENIYDIDDFAKDEYTILVLEEESHESSPSRPVTSLQRISLGSDEAQNKSLFPFFGSKPQTIFDLDDDQTRDVLLRNNYQWTFHISEIDGKLSNASKPLFEQVDPTLVHKLNSECAEVLAHEIYSDVSCEYLKRGIDDVKLSTGLKMLHFGGELKANMSRSRSVLNAHKTSEKKIYAERCFPRGVYVIGNCFKSVTKEAREFFNSTGVTPHRIVEFFKEFGHFVPNQIVVGGKLWYLTDVKAENTNNKTGNNSDLELVAKANVHLFSMKAGGSRSREESNNELVSNSGEKINICAVGGKEDLCEDTEKWVMSLEDYHLWKTIKILDFKPTYEYLAPEIRNQIHDIILSGQAEKEEDSSQKEEQVKILKQKLEKARANVEGKGFNESLVLGLADTLSKDGKLKMTHCYDIRFNTEEQPIKFMDKVVSNAPGFDKYQKQIKQDMLSVMDRIAHAEIKKHHTFFVSDGHAEKFGKGEWYTVNEVSTPPCIELHRHEIAGYKFMKEALLFVHKDWIKYGLMFDKVIFEVTLEN